MSIPDRLFGLAPTNLEIYRIERYDGGGFDVSLSEFAPEDVSLIIQLYNAVKKTYELWLDMHDSPNYELMKEHIIAHFGSEHFVTAMQSVGAATYALDKYSPSLRKVIHDIRSGALGVLIGYVHFLKLDQVHLERDLQQAVLVTRDHAKLMRNAISDLDPLVRQADESIKVHAIDDFVKKWHGSVYHVADRAIKVKVACTFEGSITNRCLETSAIDRVLYNYLNNAARFAADDTVVLTIFPVNAALVRWVVHHTITSSQQAWLVENTAGDLTKLFEGGLTHGGRGLGLSNCTDFVSTSFGIAPEMALDKGYLGARLIDQVYYAWFHWPSYVSEAYDEPTCACDS